MAALLHWAALAVLIGFFGAISHQSYRHFDRKHASRGNLLIRVLSLAATAVFGLSVFLTRPGGAVTALAALTLACLGIATFVAALRSTPRGTLHVAWTGSGPDRLVTQGVYAHVRNPLYLSYLLYWAAWAVLAQGVWWALGIFVGFLGLYRAAILDEERFLSARFGDSYRVYRARTGRLLPRLFPRLSR